MNPEYFYRAISDLDIANLRTENEKEKIMTVTKSVKFEADDMLAFQEVEKQYDGLYRALEKAIDKLTVEVDALQEEKGYIQKTLTEILRVQDLKQDLLCKSERDLDKLEEVWEAHKARVISIWKESKS